MAERGDPLARLVVLDRLEVGPVRVEPRRIVAPYRVVAGEADSAAELAYRFEEEVFDPDDPAAVNLAALATAQVALNYGLFCRRIVFRGPFDQVDRRFLGEMAENTAREIYVKKFLEHNPYLLDSARGLPAIKKESYLAAELEFPDAVERVEPGGWAPGAGGHAVLASGGKDSLLSYGLLAELGRAPHSVFVNESGRHWYTARNGYRYLRDTAPERTARVWTSSDRVFSWMLRRLPFIRPDFADVRGDEYPIRLWTVAVFLFGALPVVRKRQLGRLVIGDEFDTTVRVRHEGIPHYDGLYDQSRFFDERLTRFFLDKGWGVRQFSLLRPLSELLIQKLLATRYPELHRHQVSCHATHLVDERAYPCGKCEKCRRIVGMHLALGLDPKRCGYTGEQIERCMRELAERGVHQEAAGARQLAWMLGGRGLLPPEAPGMAGAREHPEILRLRFTPQASPPESIPADLRAGIWRLMLEGAGGAVRREARQWVPFDPLAPEVLARPYKFEPPPAETAAAPSRRPGSYLLAEMTWPEAKARLAETDTALLPVGAIEQHGLHLPLDTDAWDAEHVCRRVAERCSEPRPLVLPLIPYGVSYHHLDFPGTLSISPETLSRLVYEVGTTAARHGIRKLVIVNGHGGNAPTLQLAAQLINRDAHIFTCVDSGETSDADIEKIAETPGDVHAGEIETSTALASRPELVDMSRARREVPRFSSRYLDFSSNRSVEWYAYTARISESGVMGDATKASREKGEQIWEVMITRLTEFVEALKGMSLAQIHERHL